MTPLMPVPFWAVKKPAMEPAPTAEPRSAVPEPFWVTSRAVPVELVVRLVLAVPAAFVADVFRGGPMLVAA